MDCKILSNQMKMSKNMKKKRRKTDFKSNMCHLEKKNGLNKYNIQK